MKNNRFKALPQILAVPLTLAPGLYVASVRNGDRRSVLRFIP